MSLRFRSPGFRDKRFFNPKGVKLEERLFGVSSLVNKEERDFVYAKAKSMPVGQRTVRDALRLLIQDAQLEHDEAKLGWNKKMLNGKRT